MTEAIQHIKKNKTLPFTAMWMDIENIMPSEINQILCDVTYMWNLKNNVNETACKTETDSQTQKTNCGYQSVEGRGRGTLKV